MHFVIYFTNILKHKQFEKTTGFAAFPELKELMGEDTSQAFQILARAGIGEDCETLKSALAVCFKKFMKHAKDNADKIKSMLESVLTKIISGSLFFLNLEAK